jgi:hypothetical protein
VGGWVGRKEGGREREREGEGGGGSGGRGGKAGGGGGGRDIDRDYQELCSISGLLHYRMATWSVNGNDFTADACPRRASVRVR